MRPGARADIKRTKVILDELPALVTETRMEYSHSLRQAAQIVGCDHTHLWKIEAGEHSPRFPLLRALLDYVEG